MHQVDELKTGDKGDGQLNGQESGSSKVMFLPEQQSRVQELIDDAYKKAYAKAMKGRGANDEVERLKGEVERLKVEKKSAVILRALSRHNVIDADEVAELVKDRVRVNDDGSVSIVGDSGGARINQTGAPMGVEEFVLSWLDERPHHLRPAGLTGAGSRPSGFRPGSGVARIDTADPNAWRNMPRAELDRLLREGVVIQGSTGQTYKFKDVKNPFVEARKRKIPV